MENTDKQETDAFLNIVNDQLQAFENTLDYSSLSKAKDLILAVEKNGGRVHVTGIGKPGHVSGYAASLLSSTGTPAYELHGTEAVHGSSGQVMAGDVVIAISNSGETAELKATVTCLKKNNAHIIAVTGNNQSWLANESEVCLTAPVDQEGDSMNKPPRASILAEILILQSLSILLQNEKKLTPQQYVRWHPGGALGASIRKEENKEMK